MNEKKMCGCGCPTDCYSKSRFLAHGSLLAERDCSVPPGPPPTSDAKWDPNTCAWFSKTGNKGLFIGVLIGSLCVLGLLLMWDLFT